MDRNMFKRIGCFILSLLLLSLCGCAGNRLSKEAAQAEMDALLVQLMACVEKNDIEGACAIAYVPEQMRQEFPGIVNYWPARSTDPYEVSKLRISSGDRQGETVYQAVYLVNTDGVEYQVSMDMRRDADNEGISSFRTTRIYELVDVGLLPEALGTPIAGMTGLQWCFTAFWFLSFLLSLLAIIHLLLKRPKLYGLWILFVPLFLGLFVYSHPGNTLLRMKAGLFSLTQMTRYSNGVNTYQVCLPVGAIIYWCWYLRRLWKRKKARRMSHHSAHHVSHHPADATAHVPPEEPAPIPLSESQTETAGGTPQRLSEEPQHVPYTVLQQDPSAAVPYRPVSDTKHRHSFHRRHSSSYHHHSSSSHEGHSSSHRSHSSSSGGHSSSSGGHSSSSGGNSSSHHHHHRHHSSHHRHSSGANDGNQS